MLAESLKAGKYRPKPVPKPAPPETPQARYKRKLKSIKADFRREIDERVRSDKGNERKFGFVDLDIPSYEFDEIFDSYKYGQYKYDPLTYKLKESSWFFEFLQYLVKEGFTLEPIRTNYSNSWDEDDTYSIRVRWD